MLPNAPSALNALAARLSERCRCIPVHSRDIAVLRSPAEFYTELRVIVLFAPLEKLPKKVPIVWRVPGCPIFLFFFRSVPVFTYSLSPSPPPPSLSFSRSLPLFLSLSIPLYVCVFVINFCMCAIIG